MPSEEPLSTTIAVDPGDAVQAALDPLGGVVGDDDDGEVEAHPASEACTARSASTTAATSSSECAGESGSDSTSAPARSATGSGAWSG